jgi:hypothetical protein
VFVFSLPVSGGKNNDKKQKEKRKFNYLLNRAVLKNRDRFTGFSGSHWFTSVFSVFSPVFKTNGSA